MPGRWAPRAAVFALALVLAATPAAAGIPCDANGDGVADQGDLFALALFLNGGGPPPENPCDADGSGLLDEDDLEALAARFVRRAPVAAREIGPAGGVVAGAGLTVTVPAGALGAATTVTVWTTVTETADDDATSGSWRLTGLPPAPALPVTVSFPVAGLDGLPPLPPEAIADGVAPVDYAAVLTHALADGAFTAGKELLADAETTTVDGTRFLTAAIVPGWVGPDGAVQLHGTRRYAVPDAAGGRAPAGVASVSSRSDHFFVPLRRAQIAPYYSAGFGTLLEDMERWRDAIAALFGLPWKARTGRTRVCFAPTAGDAEAVMSNVGWQGDWIELSEVYLSNGYQAHLKPEIAHELTHLLEYQYDPRDATPVSRLGFAYPYRWLNEAVATYAEWKIDPSWPLPDTVKEYAAYPLSGLHQTEETVLRRLGWGTCAQTVGGTTIDACAREIQRHGYGLMTLIADMVDRAPSGELLVGDLYRDIEGSVFASKHPVEVLRSAWPIDREKWGDYLHRLIGGQVVPGIPADVFLGGVDYLLGPGQQRTETWQRTQELGGELLRVGLGGSWSADDRVTANALELAGDELRHGSASVAAFEVSAGGTAITLLDLAEPGWPILSVPDPAGIAARGGSLLLLFAYGGGGEPWTDRHEIDAIVRTGSVAARTDQLRLSTGILSFQVSGLESLWRYDFIEPWPPELAYFIAYAADFPDEGTPIGVTASLAADPAHCDPRAVAAGATVLETRVMDQPAQFFYPCAAPPPVAITEPMHWGVAAPVSFTYRARTYYGPGSSDYIETVEYLEVQPNTFECWWDWTRERCAGIYGP